MTIVANYTRSNAIASGEWGRRGEHTSWLAWARPIADAGTLPPGFVRPVVFFKHGGAETNWEDLEILGSWSTLVTDTTIAATGTGFTDSGNRFGTLVAGDAIQLSGFVDSDINVVYEVLTVAAGVITTSPAPAATESAGASVVVQVRNKDAYYTMVNDFFAVLISYDTSPGWARTPNNESSSSRDIFASHFENATAISYFRSIMSAPGGLNPLPDDIYITTDPEFSAHGGSSSGGYDVLRTQLMPDGTLEYGRGNIISGSARFGRKYGHTCNVLLCNIPQTTLSQFHEQVDVLSGGDSSYTLASAASATATQVSVSGDTAELKRGSRIEVRTTTFLQANGLQSTSGTSLSVKAVGGNVPATKRAVYLRMDLGGNFYRALLNVDAAAITSGNTATYQVRLWTTDAGGTINPVQSIPDNTPIQFVQEFALTEDMDTGGSSPYTMYLFPSLKTDLASGSVVVVQHYAPEAYGELSWAHQYLFSSTAGWVWRSDDASGNGFPLAEKIPADIDQLLSLDNPRVYEVHPIFSGAEGTSLAQCSLSGDDSFWNMYTPGEINPAYIDLHDQFQAWYVAHWLYSVAENSTVAAYMGSFRSNPLAGADATVPWNLGRNAAYTATVVSDYLEALNWSKLT